MQFRFILHKLQILISLHLPNNTALSLYALFIHSSKMQFQEHLKGANMKKIFVMMAVAFFISGGFAIGQEQPVPANAKAQTESLESQSKKMHALRIQFHKAKKDKKATETNKTDAVQKPAAEK